MTALAPAQAGLHRDQYHRYSWNGDGPLVGVTTPLRLQDVLIGGDLASWGGGIAARYMLEHPGADLAMALGAVTEARDIGTLVHAEIEKILRGQPVSPTEKTAPYVYSFSAFLAKERPEFVGVEMMVANLTYRYAGTLDIAARLRGKLALVDVKSGKPKLSHRLQLAGYAAAEFVGEEGNPEPLPLPKFRATYLLYLRPDGYDLEEVHLTSEDRRHFLALVRAYQLIRKWNERNGK